MKMRRLLFLLFIIASEGCHLATECRKKRSVDTRRRPGGCASTRAVHMIELGSKLLGALHKYGLTDETMNNQLANCLTKKATQENADLPAEYRYLEIRSVLRYYQTYNYLKNSEECKQYKEDCRLVKECLIHITEARVMGRKISAPQSYILHHNQLWPDLINDMPYGGR